MEADLHVLDENHIAGRASPESLVELAVIHTGYISTFCVGQADNLPSSSRVDHVNVKLELTRDCSSFESATFEYLPYLESFSRIQVAHAGGNLVDAESLIDFNDAQRFGHVDVPRSAYHSFSLSDRNVSTSWSRLSFTVPGRITDRQVRTGLEIGSYQLPVTGLLNERLSEKPGCHDEEGSRRVED